MAPTEPVLSERQQLFFKRLYKRCEVQMALIRGAQDFYLSDSITPDQKRHLETTIGAGLWYIRSSGIWSGRISRAALESYHPDLGVKQPRLTADHEYPRKLAATELLERAWSAVENPASELLQLFLDRYGSVNYVTPAENRRLSQFQRADAFTSPAEAYKRAEVNLVGATDAQLASIKRREKSVIEALLHDSA